MTRAHLAAATIVLLLTAAACSGDDTDVLGVRVDRDETPATPTVPDEPAGQPTSDADRAEPTSAPASPSIAASPTSTPTPTATSTAGAATDGSDSSGTRTSEPGRSEPTAPASPTASPSPSPPPPLVLDSGDGQATLTWTPETDEPDFCCWIETSSQPPEPSATRRAVRARLVDAEPGEDAYTRRVRPATCDPWLQAPDDRDLVARGTVVVEVEAGDTAVSTVSHGVDVTVPAGERHALGAPSAYDADADDGLDITCRIAFTAA